MSGSISCSERARRALEALQKGERLPRDTVRALGEECPAEFFRTVIESLADSFDGAQTSTYDELMAAWDLRRSPSASQIPEGVECVYVLSRVTLGADIKIASMILDTMKRRFAAARIVFVAGRKSIELFEADERLEFVEAVYPRTGPVSSRIDFGKRLGEQLALPGSLVVDPDSRITQLGLIPLSRPGHYFHFSSRTAGGSSARNLSDLTNEWLKKTFGMSGNAYIAPRKLKIECEHPATALSLGVGENESKRITGDFESHLIRLLGERFSTLHIDRGAGGEEARRVTAAVESSGTSSRVRFHEGSFAAFASVIAQTDFYIGYDSAGQHAAAAAGIPLISLFKGAPSDVFRARWEPYGPGPRLVLAADKMSPAQLLTRIFESLPASLWR